jgi:uncharacterized protein YndB with AHSA1/START domain
VQARATTHIECSPDRVFDLLADARNETEWNSRVSRVELESAEPVGPGSRFTIVNSGSTYDARITTYERPTRVVFEATGNPDVRVAYLLAPSGDGTKLESDLEFRPPGISKALFFVLTPVIRRNVRKQYASFKALCEG